MILVSVEGLYRVSTGIEGLDMMLKGGLIAGRSYLVVGNPGSGKSILGGHFLMEGINRDERVLYIAIDEPPSEIMSNFEALGWNPGKITILNAHPKVREYKVRGSLIEVAARRSVGALSDLHEREKTVSKGEIGLDLSLPSLQLMLQKEFDEKSYDRLVIDSITSLRLLGAREIAWEVGINSIIRLLTEENVTAMLISDDPVKNMPVPPEFFLSRGIIRLQRIIVKGKAHHCIYVEKLRGSAHDAKVRPMKIASQGIKIDIKKSPNSEVMNQLKLQYPTP